MSPSPKTLIVIAGPTAVGKTAVAIELAQQLKTEIISADSRQCYVGMAIGTAQPSLDELQVVPHHFINCYQPEESLTAADFERIALEHLEDIFEQNNTAIVCGGTGLYIKALCEGLDEMPAMDKDIVDSVNQFYISEGIERLRSELLAEDPLFAASGEMNNPSRMIRALAFKRSIGASITVFRTGIRKERPFRIIKIGLELPRELLYQRINHRVDLMMQQGLLQEAERLFPKRDLKNLNTVGYSELFDFFEHKTDLSTAIEKIKQHSRNYAKRQMTWFKKDQEFLWLNGNAEAIIAKVQKMLP